MTKKKILMITPYLPAPSQSGGQTRSYYLLKNLHKNVDISIICFTRNQIGLTQLKKFCKKVILVERGTTWDLTKILKTGFGPYPFLVSNYISNNLKSVIKNELQNHDYDLIHTECFYLMPNIPKTNIPTLLVDQTIEYAVYQHYTETLSFPKSILKPLLYLDVAKIKHWEQHYWQKADALVVVSKDDRSVVTSDTKRSKVEIIANGVDEKYLLPNTHTAKTIYPSVLFGVSNMKWMQNSECARLLLENIWPEIKKSVPKAKLFIIGRHAPAIFSQYRSADIIVSEAGADGTFNDPISYYQRCWLLVAPILSGNGTRTKFFEAMACGLPIVTTSQGMEGIEIANKKHAVVVPLAEIAHNSISLLGNITKRQEIGRQANLMVSKKYTWAKSAEKLKTLYQSIANSRNA